MVLRFQKSVLIFLFAVAAIVIAGDETVTNNPSDRSEHQRSLPRDCSSKYTTTCLKLDIVSWVDKINEDDNYNLIPGVYVVKENGTNTTNTAELVSELAREFPKNPDARLDAFLLRKVSDFIQSHSIKLNLLGNAVGEGEEETGRKGGGGGSGLGLSGGGGGGGKKGGGMGGAIIAMAAMMKGTLLALALGGLAALAGKALMTGLISLVLSAVLGLKSLSGGGGKTTYEVIAKPIYTHENTHSSSHESHHAHDGGGHGWGRSYDIPLPLGLRPEYKPA